MATQGSARKRQQLTKGMEHMREAVVITEAPKTPDLGDDAYGVPASLAPVRRPPHRSHDPSNNQKRTDPFQFGSRYLEEGDDIFEHNAWDHVETDDAYKEFSELQFAKQREAPVSDFDKKRFNSDPAKWWNLFYKEKKANFFKNRKWLQQEFPILSDLTQTSSPPTLLLEVGAGAGNTAFPILALNQNPNLKIHACDFSKKAVEIIRNNEAYDEKYIQADVWDLAASGEGALPPGVLPESVDVVMMVFVFSALAPQQWTQALKNLWRVLKPGGAILFRDYGRGDLAQVRFKKGRYMEENFYVRGDGTRVYFFDKDELIGIWTGKVKEVEAENAMADSQGNTDAAKRNGDSTDDVPAHGLANLTLEERAAAGENENYPSFEVDEIGVDRRMLVNRQRKLKMYRCWMQARFRKPKDITQTSTS